MKDHLHPGHPASCDSCGIVACPLHLKEQLADLAEGGQAWLLDEKWSEFDTYLCGSGATEPQVLVPWRGRRPAYAWSLPARARIRALPWLTLRRSLAIRSLGQQGRRQEVMEAFDQEYAAAYARRLHFHTTRLVVWQNYLPFLQRQKILGGRRYDVLLWRAPRDVLHRALEEAKERYPESRTLRDFRSSTRLAEAERESLEHAHRVVTPHTQLAGLYPAKTIRLQWSLPAQENGLRAGGKIAFLGPTLGRRGAYLVRDAMRLLGRPLMVVGRNLEAPDFWSGLEIEQRAFGPGWLDGIGLLLAPALTEFKPRLLLEALGRGVPVIATAACGLPEMNGLHLVAPYDTEALAQKISSLACD